MEENITMGFPEAAENDVLLPEGWTEDVDIFDESYSGGLSLEADELPEEDRAESWDTADSLESGNVFTTGGKPEDGAETQGGAEKAHTTGQDKPTPGKLKFSAVVDHEKRDVELEESELPVLYQKAQVTDRVQTRLKEIGPAYRKAKDTARELGYDSLDAMLQSLRGGRSEAAQGKNTAQSGLPRQLERDIGAELKVLHEQFPDAQQVPDEIFAISSAKGKPLAEIYADYRREKTEARALRLENQQLRQNALAASRAPVRGVSRGGATDTMPEDAFVRGFDADGW